jgi:hypothetical protein
MIIPRIGDFVAKKIGDWVLTGVVVDYFNDRDDICKVLWSPNPNHPVSAEELYESFEHFGINKVVVIRSEKDIPDDFLLPT